jgi:hypothetical protein
MYSFLISPEIRARAVASADEYDWLTYSKAAPLRVNANLSLHSGSKFGVRPCAADPSTVKLVLHGNLDRVFTISMEAATKIAKGTSNERRKR